MSDPTSTSKNLFATVFFSVAISAPVGMALGILVIQYQHQGQETSLRSECIASTAAIVETKVAATRREVLGTPTPAMHMDPGEYTGRVFTDGTALLTKVGSKCLQYAAGISFAERSRGIVRIPPMDEVGGWGVQAQEISQHP